MYRQYKTRYIIDQLTVLMAQAYRVNRETYSLRYRSVSFQPIQEVFVKSFSLGRKRDSFNANLTNLPVIYVTV